MIPRSFRQFGNVLVKSNQRVVDVLKELNDKYISYRTEGIVELKNPIYSCTHEIYFSYVENFSWDDLEQEESDGELGDESLYELYERGIEPNHID